MIRKRAVANLPLFTTRKFGSLLLFISPTPPRRNPVHVSWGRKKHYPIYTVLRVRYTQHNNNKCFNFDDKLSNSTHECQESATSWKLALCPGSSRTEKRGESLEELITCPVTYYADNGITPPVFKIHHSCIYSDSVVGSHTHQNQRVF